MLVEELLEEAIVDREEKVGMRLTPKQGVHLWLSVTWNTTIKNHLSDGGGYDWLSLTKALHTNGLETRRRTARKSLRRKTGKARV